MVFAWLFYGVGSKVVFVLSYIRRICLCDGCCGVRWWCFVMVGID